MDAFEREIAAYAGTSASAALSSGTAAEMDEICSICREHSVPLIEDAAESQGTTYRGKMTGTFGD